MSATGIHDPFEVDDAPRERSLAALADDRSAFALETWLGRGLLVLALVAALVCDLRLVSDTASYFPDNESNHIAVTQYIAHHGTPPVLGRDVYVIDPPGAVPPHTTVLHGLTPGASPSVSRGTVYQQVYGLDRPGAYYVAVPLAWLVPWNHLVLAWRLLSILVVCAGIVFLWAAVREAWPANPVAAGVAAVVLGTMSGLVEGFITFDPDVLLFTLWCAGIWLVLRDLRLRRCSPWTVGVCVAATCVASSAVPAAVAAVVWLSLRAAGAQARGRLLALRVGAVLASTVVWVLWNLHAYSDPWPLNTSILPGQPDRVRNWHELTSGLGYVYAVSVGIFDDVYASGVAPLRAAGQRPESAVAALFVLALSWALWSGRVADARLALARLGALMLGSFVSIYGTIFLASVFAAAPLDAGMPHFAGYAAAWAGVAGAGLTAPLVGRRRLTVVAVALLALVLVGLMLQEPAL
jgi:hypothetical protein